MRKGAKRHDWTTADTAYLIEWAGKKTVRELCRDLRKSSQAIYSKARHLREQGQHVSLRCFVPRTQICPGCGCSRSTMGDSGICKLCRKRGVVSSLYVCRAFRYDPLKREPGAPPPVQKLEYISLEEDAPAE